jgi:ribosomal protein L44E
MPEHYTKDTVQVSVWCNPCNKHTMHRVDHGRRGPCLECMAKQEEKSQERKRAPAKAAPVQLKMF